MDWKREARFAVGVLVLFAAAVFINYGVKVEAADEVVVGAFRPSVETVATKSAAYTVGANDQIILCNTQGGAFSLTLPSNPVTVTGKRYTFIRTGTGTNACTLDAGTFSINGSVTYAAMDALYDAVDLVSTGTAWQIVGNKIN